MKKLNKIVELGSKHVSKPFKKQNRIIFLGILSAAGLSAFANCYDSTITNGTDYHNNNNYTVICDSTCGVLIAQCHEYTYDPEVTPTYCGNPAGTYTGEDCDPHTDTTTQTGRNGSGQCTSAGQYGGCSGSCVDWRDITPANVITYEDDSTITDVNCEPPTY